MKKSRKEFIKEAYSHACFEWKQKIEKEFPKLFPKTELEVGKWYKVESNLYDAIVFNNGTNDCYGFNFSGIWTEIFGLKNSVNSLKKITEATREEVEEALIKEAERRGVWDCPIIDVYGDKMKQDIFFRGYINNELFSGYGRVFLDGK